MTCVYDSRKQPMPTVIDRSMPLVWMHVGLRSVAKNTRTKAATTGVGLQSQLANISLQHFFSTSLFCIRRQAHSMPRIAKNTAHRERERERERERASLQSVRQVVAPHSRRLRPVTACHSCALFIVRFSTIHCSSYYLTSPLPHPPPPPLPLLLVVFERRAQCQYTRLTWLAVCHTVFSPSKQPAPAKAVLCSVWGGQGHKKEGAACELWRTCFYCSWQFYNTRLVTRRPLSRKVAVYQWFGGAVVGRREGKEGSGGGGGGGGPVQEAIRGKHDTTWHSPRQVTV